MRRSTGELVRQLAAAGILSAIAVAAMFAAAGKAGAADLTVYPAPPVVHVCPGPREVVILYDKEGRPTVPARTPYFTCVTGTTLLPGDIPPPPEYCCA